VERKLLSQCVNGFTYDREEDAFRGTGDLDLIAALA